jgi:hypothetical protein
MYILVDALRNVHNRDAHSTTPEATTGHLDPSTTPFKAHVACKRAVSTTDSCAEGGKRGGGAKDADIAAPHFS